MRKDNWKKFLRQKQLMLAGAVMVLAAVGMTGLYISEKTTEKQEKQGIESVEDSKEVELEDLAKTDTAKVIASTESTETEQNSEVEDVTNILQPEVATKDGAEQEDAAQETKVQDSAVATSGMSANLAFGEASELLWPVQGNVIMNYSMDQTIYYATLQQYRYNPAVIIAGNVNDKVLCAADGIITEVSNDAVTGCTVTMDLGNGYTAVYGQLKEVPYAKGAYVEAGTVLGYVSEPTKYYSVEGSNLYFELLQDGLPINPISFFE